jgi:hypothetical protein
MAKETKKKSLSEAVSKEIKGKFDLNTFKTKKGIGGNVKFKDQEWIHFSKALQDVLSIPGIPHGHLSMVRGKSDTGKSTVAVELAINAQKRGILPVLIITEMKHSWNYWRNMGFQMEDVVDKETGEILDYEGFFIYRDRSTISSIEDVASFIIDMLDEQKKGNLPYDLLFIWDSVGSIPCDMSIAQGKNNPMWNAGAIATQFGNFVNQKIMMSRKEGSLYTNSLFIVNKTGVMPAESVMSQPKMTNKGGDTFYFDCSLAITFGNITNSGTSRIRAVKGGKKVEFAYRTKVVCSKNHVNGVATAGNVISTAYGFIDDDKKAIDKYKKEHSHEWGSILGDGNYDIEEDGSEWEEQKSTLDKIMEDEIELG